jgi:phosphoglycerol transferase
LSFTNISQTLGTSWTIAGMVASQCGTPLLYNDTIIGGNDIMQNGFFTDVICLGDVLNKAGYVQKYLGGASSRFAGKGNFYKAHHYDEVKGLDELISRLNNKEYKTGWGLYDDSLFKIAAEEYVRLANANKPFNLTLLTLDTHHPNGHPSHSCKAYPYQDNSILDAVHCTDQLLERFINNISRHPSFQNTVVVLISDHLAMRNSAEKFFPKKYGPVHFPVYSLD